jgi:hypothetical protein
MNIFIRIIALFLAIWGTEIVVAVTVLGAIGKRKQSLHWLNVAWPAFAWAIFYSTFLF